MLGSSYLTTEDLYYSLLYGDGVYEWKGEILPDPLATLNDSTGSSPVLTGVFTGEEFYARRYYGKKLDVDRLCNQILRPPKGDVILWPHDLISMTREQRDSFKLFAGNQYVEAPAPASDRPGKTALLFTRLESEGTVRVHTILERIDVLNWKNPQVRQLAVQILLAFEKLNLLGYVYNDINPARFLMRPDGSVKLDYSTLVYSFQDYRSSFTQSACSPKAGEYPLEFAEPAYVRGLINQLDFDSQNYGLAAFLFYIFFGRGAYDGKLLVGQSDDSVLQHYVKLREYHKMPIFIFDDKDDRNALGDFGEDQVLLDLWDECPARLCELFSLVLCEDNALRKRQATNPPPRMWLSVFEELGWMNSSIG